MKRVLILGTLLGLALGTSAFAANEGPGCGLGSMLFKGQSGMVPMTLAATTNGTSGNQTFGMTSGTLGCKADSVILNDKVQEAYVATNLGTLQQELAQGQGEHVVALASLMGCPAEVRPAFASMGQERFTALFPTDDTGALAVLAGLKAEVARRPLLASACGKIS